ncbi:MAG: hypothetical protein RL693_1367 [Verrucomicrobiota bacterium]|jgi:YHS domain-containing protein
MKTLLHSLALTILFAGISSAIEPVNDKCPVCGKNGRLIFHSSHEGKRFIFDTAECKDKFDKAPTSFKITPKK